MVKKSIFVIALLGMLATASFAQDLPTTQEPGQLKIDGKWPVEVICNWEPIDLCVIEVHLKIGMFIEIVNCNNLKINLVQVNCSEVTGGSFPCYKACTTITVKSNFNAIISVRKGPLQGNNILQNNKWRVYFRQSAQVPTPTSDTWQINGNGQDNTLQVCVEAWDANIYLGAPTQQGNGPQVAEVIISAIPDATVPCCTP